MTAILEKPASDTDRLRALSEMRTLLDAAAEPRSVFADGCAIAGRVLPHDEARLVLFTLPRQSTAGARAELEDVHVMLPIGSPGVTGGVPIPDPRASDQSVPVGVLTIQLPSGDVAGGVRALVRSEGTVVGALTLLSRNPRQYTECDVFFVQLIADQIANALVRRELATLTRGAALERERAANLEASEQLLQALASVLDIRQVFPQLSDIARKVLRHDRLTMMFIDAKGNCVMEAASNDDGPLGWRASGVDVSMLTD